MKTLIGALFAICLTAGLIDVAPAAHITNDDLQGTIQSLIYSYNQLDNKLERHEHRERALGELLKKALQSLQRGQKNLEPINGIFARLDERVSQIETMLIAQEEKYNHDMDRLNQGLGGITKWMHQNEECSRMAAGQAGGASPSQQEPEAYTKLLKEIGVVAAGVQAMHAMSKRMLKLTEATSGNAPTTVEMLRKIDEQLVSYAEAPPKVVTVAPADNSAFESALLEKLDGFATEIRGTLATTTAREGFTATDRELLTGLTNQTLNALQRTEDDVIAASNKAFTEIASGVRESVENLERGVYQVIEDAANSSRLLESFYNKMDANYGKMQEALEIFNKFNNILMTNSEYVLDTQRKIEFGTYQVVQKISDLLNAQSDGISTMMRERFDSINATIQMSHLEAMNNLSSLMESEISHVWRQIEIMTSEITNSRELVDILQAQTGLYVNNTLTTMNSTNNKVQLIMSRMTDLDANLNFLVGKLAVMSQEFTSVKSALGETLDKIRDTFNSLKGKMGNNEYETELKLLEKDAV